MVHAGLFVVAVEFLWALILFIIEGGTFISDVKWEFMSNFDHSGSVCDGATTAPVDSPGIQWSARELCRANESNFKWSRSINYSTYNYHYTSFTRNSNYSNIIWKVSETNETPNDSYNRSRRFRTWTHSIEDMVLHRWTIVVHSSETDYGIDLHSRVRMWTNITCTPNKWLEWMVTHGWLLMCRWYESFLVVNILRTLSTFCVVSCTY